MKERIIQIIPAPSDLEAIYLTGLYDEQGHEHAYNEQVCALALVESADGYQEVRAMITVPHQDGLVFASEAESFLTLCRDRPLSERQTYSTRRISND